MVISLIKFLFVVEIYSTARVPACSRRCTLTGVLADPMAFIPFHTCLFIAPPKIIILNY